MGMTTISIPFFTDNITLRPHTASDAKYIGRKVSIRRFAGNKPCSLERVQETGEYIVSMAGNRFMHGPEV